MVIDMIKNDPNISEEFKEGLTPEYVVLGENTKWTLLSIGDSCINLNSKQDHVIEYLNNFPLTKEEVVNIINKHIKTQTRSIADIRRAIYHYIEPNVLKMQKENGEEIKMLLVDDVLDSIDSIINNLIF